MKLKLMFTFIYLCSIVLLPSGFVKIEVFLFVFSGNEWLNNN